MSTLRNRAAKALVWDLMGNYGGQIIAFLLSIFLARLLSPSDFGLVGMSMFFIVVLEIFKDFGFAAALIQSRNNTSLTYSSVFYLNLLVGSLLTVLLYFAAPLIADFYGNLIITDIVRLLSIIFFINSFNIVQAAILQRNLDFKKLSIRDLVSQFIGGIVAVYLAFNGAGVYALVVQQILAAIIQTILLWKLTEWYPKWEFSSAELKKLSSFSFYILGAGAVNQILQKADTLVIGKLFSPSSLGFFTRAKSLNEVIISNSFLTIRKVFFPVLSTIQDDKERFEKIFLKVINIVTVISVFLTAIFYMVGEELIIGMFGQKWEPSVVIFKILIISGFTYPISGMIVNAFLAKGKSKQNFHYGNIRKLLQLVPFPVIIFFGFTPFLYALLLVSFTAWLLNMYFVERSLDISFIKQIKIISPILLVSLVFVVIIELLIPDEFSYAWAMLKVLSFSLMFLIFLYLSKSEVISEFNYYKKMICLRLKK